MQNTKKDKENLKKYLDKSRRVIEGMLRAGHEITIQIEVKNTVTGGKLIIL